MAIVQQGLTLDEFLKLPEEEPAGGHHSALQGAVCELISPFARPMKLAYAFLELRTTYGGHSYVPDAAVYRWERIPRTAAGEVADDFFKPPDIAVEVVSPEQSVNALVRRCLWYVDHGVRLALLIDPDDRSVIMFRPGSQPSALRGADRIDVADVLPGFQLTVADLFAALSLE